jgi:hypothetical protein
MRVTMSSRRDCGTAPLEIEFKRFWPHSRLLPLKSVPGIDMSMPALAAPLVVCWAFQSLI